MCFIIVISSLSPAVPAPPATFPSSLSSAGAEKNPTTLHHLHSIRIIIPRNALQSLREVRGTKHRGNHLPPVIISHLSAALEEDPAGLGGSHVQPTDRRTDRQRNGLMWLRCPESISDSQCFGSAAAPLGTGSTRASAFRSVCQASPYPQILKHWTCHSEDVGAFKNPKASTSWDLHHEKKNPPGGWSVWHPVRICERFLEEFFVGRCGVPVWLQNGFAIKSSLKPSNFLKQTYRKNKTLIGLQCPWSIRLTNVLAALQIHRGLAAEPR